MSLDDKLREILNDFGNSVKDQSSWMALGGEYESKNDPIAQIKQAFTEEYLLVAHGKPGETIVLTQGDVQAMTGQEWYDRFEKEFAKFDPEGGQKFVETAIIAAKKASKL